LFVFGSLSASAAEAAAGPAPALNSVAAVRALSADEAAKGHPVRLSGVVTYYDPDRYLLFVQDETGGIFVNPGRRRFEVQAGQRVQVAGITDPGQVNPIIANPELSSGTRAPWPAPRAVSLRELAAGALDCQWVTLEGSVRSAEDRGGRLELTLVEAGARLKAVVHSLPQQGFQDLVGARLRLEGACGVAGNEQRQVTNVVLLVPGHSHLAVSERGPDDLFATTVRPLAELARSALAAPLTNRIRVLGVVSEFRPGEWLVVKDGLDTLHVLTAMTRPVQAGIVVDVVGFPMRRGDAWGLEDGVFRRVGFAAEPLRYRTDQTSATALSGETLPLFTHVSEIHGLSAAEARRGYPVRLRGVVTFYDPVWRLMFFQGATEGIFVETAEHELDIGAGRLVMLYGYSGPGDFAPVIRQPRFEVLGRAPMPEARRLTRNQLMTGQYDSQWVETRGVVAGITNEPGHLWLEIAAEGGTYRAMTPYFWDQPMPSHLLGAQVSLRGACGTLFNQNRQFLGIQLYVPGLASVTVEQQPASDPFADPVQSVASLMQYRYRAGAERPVHLAGTVTLNRGTRSFFLQDSTGGILIEASDTPALRPGDSVDVLGFPAVGDVSPIVKAARVRKRSSGAGLKPLPATAARALASPFSGRLLDATLVQIEARLLSQRAGPEGQVFVLEEGQVLFDALLPGARTQGPEPLQPNSLLRLTGVCSVRVDEDRWPRSFRVLLRSSRDLELLASPPWWNPERTDRALQGVAVAALAVLVWLLTLQMRLRRQTAVLREQFQSEAALQQRYADLFENASDAVYTADLTGHLTSINRAGERILGYSREELAGMHVDHLVAPEYLGLTREMTARKLRGESPPPYEIEVVTKQGQRVAAELNTRLILRDGKPIGIQGVARDSTERKRGEARAAAHAELGHRLSEAATPEQAARVVLDTADRFFAWDACSLVLRVGEQERFVQAVLVDTLGGRRVDVPAPNDESLPTPIISRVLREGALLILRDELAASPHDLLPFGDTERRSASLMFVPIRHGPQVIGVLTFQSYRPHAYTQADLTTLQTLADHCGGALERLRLEAARRESEARKSAILESALDCVITLDPQGRILEFNSAAEKAFGRSRAQVTGRFLDDIAFPPNLRQGFRESLANGSAGNPASLLNHQVQTTGLRADGTEFPVELSLTRIAGDGAPCFTAVIRDITARLSLEAQLRHAQKLESVGQLAAGVAHDFNNILNVIIGYAGLLLARPRPDPEATEPLREIAAAADRAANLTRQLLTFSRKQIMQPKVLDLSHVMSQLLKMLRRILGEDIALQFSCGGNLPSVRADVGMMEQVVMNLAVNARDAMPQGGQLAISLTSANLGPADVSANPEARPGRFVCLAVADTGCGMDAATINHIFEPFFTTKDVGKGTGLGLASVYGIVKQHDGWIEVSSQPRRGTTFKVFLPAVAASTEPATATSELPGTQGHGETLLVVEDEPALRDLACHILRRYGYRVLSATNGVEALDLWARHSGEIDLMVTDMVMPGGVGGADLALQAQAQKPRLRVIYTSGYSTEIAQATPLLREGSRFLPKPYTPSTLAAFVRACLDGENGHPNELQS
jgi:PAS domain S-box-containing protein